MSDFRLITLNERVPHLGVTFVSVVVARPEQDTKELLRHWRGEGRENADHSFTFSRAVTVELRTESPISRQLAQELERSGIAVL